MCLVQKAHYTDLVECLVQIGIASKSCSSDQNKAPDIRFRNRKQTVPYNKDKTKKISSHKLPGSEAVKKRRG